jgi:hypothetical protein
MFVDVLGEAVLAGQAVQGTFCPPADQVLIEQGRTLPFTSPNPGFGTQALGVLEPGGATVLMGHGKHSTWVPPGE